jgi:hypothetical protein
MAGTDILLFDGKERSVSLTGRERMPGAKPPSPFVKWRNRFFWGLGISIFLYAIQARIEEQYDLNHRIAMPIVAEAYVWPEGCKDQEYHDNDEISSRCNSDKYFMGSERRYYWRDRPKFGLPYSARPRYYYRIGNDAIETVCFSVNFKKFEFDKCIVNRIAKDVFKVKSND